MKRKEDFDDFEWELDFSERKRAVHNRELAQHPDCRDPDHPGCDECIECNDDEEEE